MKIGEIWKIPVLVGYLAILVTVGSILLGLMFLGVIES